MMFLLAEFLGLLITLANVYTFLLFVLVLIRMCMRFGIFNPYYGIVSRIMRALEPLFEPPLEKIRERLPSFVGIDFSPLLLYFLVGLLRAGLFRVIISIS